MQQLKTVIVYNSAEIDLCKTENGNIVYKNTLNHFTNQCNYDRLYAKGRKTALKTDKNRIIVYDNMAQ